MGATLNHGFRQRHGASLAASGGLEAQAGLGLFETFNYRQLTGSQVDVAPAQGANLATAQATQNREQGRDEYWRAAHGLDQVRRLRQIIGLHRLPVDLRRIHGICGVARHQLPFDRLGEGLLEGLTCQIGEQLFVERRR